VAAIREANGVEPALVRGDDGIFDVEVDGRLVFSKREAGRFPDPEEILAKLG
jgi:selT/selW/selH-like putative selenoprotein